MTRLRQLLIEELQRRNFAETTIRSYVHGVEHFSRYFRRRPDQLGPEHIRQYQAMLFSKLKYSPNTVTLRLASLRFFYIQVLKRSWSIAETPHPKKVVHFPLILTPYEVTRLIDAADSPFHRAMLMTLYGTGARRTEVAHLKVGDIDSRRMVFHIRGGKGNLGRDVMLSQKLLDALRDHWRGLRRSSTDWLFTGNAWHTSNRPSRPRSCGRPVTSLRNVQARAQTHLSAPAKTLLRDPPAGGVFGEHYSNTIVGATLSL